MRWKFAAGRLDYDFPGFVHTVLVDIRARLRRSKAPNLVFERVFAVAKEAGRPGRHSVLDSAPLYDAVATQDTVTLIRSAIRGLLWTSGAPTKRLRAMLKRDDDDTAAGKPPCVWDDEDARNQLIDELARDGFARLEVPEGEKRYSIARRVAQDRMISTVDPQARHGHKTASRSGREIVGWMCSPLAHRMRRWTNRPKKPASKSTVTLATAPLT